MLETAIQVAMKAHQGTTDKTGVPYILHPLRVMFSMATEEEMMIAVLHDVVEDSAITLDDLRALGFSETVVQNIDHLSRRHDETYQDFIRRIKPYPLAVRIKLADLRDNMDVRRLPTIHAEDFERLQRYHWAWNYLTEGTQE